MRTTGRVTDDDDVAQVAQPVAWDGLQLRQQRLADDDHAGTRVVQDVLVVGWLEQRAGGDGHRADLDRAEESVGILGAIQQQQQHALFDAHLQLCFERVAEAVHALEHLPVGDLLVARVGLDSHVVAAPFGYVSIDEIRSYIKELTRRRACLYCSQ